MGSGRAALWDKIYRENSDFELSWYEPSPTKSSEIIRSLNLDLDCVVADVGCGESLFIDDLLRLGFRNIIAIDISEVALANLKRRLGDMARHVRFIRADITSPDFPQIRVDVWHDRTVLHFLTGEDERGAYLANLKRSLKVGGYAIFAEHSLKGPDRCSGQILRRYEPEDLAAFLGEGFTMVTQFKYDHKTPSGSIRNMTYAVFRRTSV